MLTIRRARVIALALTVIAAASSGCTPNAPAAATDCHGIPASMGACDPDLHVFTGETCQAIADEFGPALEAQAMKVVRGPRELSGERQSVRLTNAEIVVTQIASERMIELGIFEDCSMPDFLERASRHFSDEFKSGVGTVLYDNDPPATYDDWIADLSRIMSSIGKPLPST
jgi:hypothetical protein